jgi:hypothetical protein
MKDNNATQKLNQTRTTEIEALEAQIHDLVEKLTHEKTIRKSTMDRLQRIDQEIKTLNNKIPSQLPEFPSLSLHEVNFRLLELEKEKSGISLSPIDMSVYFPFLTLENQ